MSLALWGVWISNLHHLLCHHLSKALDLCPSTFYLLFANSSGYRRRIKFLSCKKYIYSKRSRASSCR